MPHRKDTRASFPPAVDRKTVERPEIGPPYSAGTNAAKNRRATRRRSPEARPDKAQFRLGLSLISGDGIAQNYDEALMWMSIAAKGGDPGLSQECTPYIMLLSLAIGPERTEKALSSARQLLSSED